MSVSELVGKASEFDEAEEWLNEQLLEHGEDKESVEHQWGLLTKIQTLIYHKRKQARGGV